MAKLRLYVEDSLSDPLPGWLTPFSRELEPVRCVELPALSGQLGLDSAGLSYCCEDGQRFRLEAYSADKASAVQRALGRPRGKRILDACAGFGNDTLNLAAQSELTLVEANLAVALFLAERVALLELASRSRAAGTSTCQLHRQDALELMRQAPAGAWDIVYLDPMFPPRNKRALPKRQMQVLAELQGLGPAFQSHDDALLLAEAQRVATDRVVLKRRLKDPVTGQPHTQIRGSKVRFDVYSA